MEVMTTEDSSVGDRSRRASRKRLYALLIAVPLVVLILALYIYPVPLSVMMSWNLTTIGSTAYEIASARDSAGGLHVAYSDGYLRYAENTGDGWTIEPVQAGVTTRFCSLAMDSQGMAHIASLLYNRTLVYIDNALGPWKMTMVDTQVWGWPISIALDSQGFPYISYSASSHLRVATNAHGNWQNTSIADTYNGESTTILIDSHDKIHVFTGDEVRRITNEDGNWTQETIYGWDLGGDRTSATLDSNGKIHISFLGSERGATNKWGVMYGANITGSWNLTFVDKLNTWGGQGSGIAVDSQGRAHLSYQDFESGRLKYARQVGGSWEIEALTKGKGQYGTIPTIALDSSGHVHIFYSASSSFALKQATNDSPPIILRFSFYFLLFVAVFLAVVALAWYGRRWAIKKDEARDGFP